MKINKFLGRSLIGLLVVMMVPFGAFSQEPATSGNAFTEAELAQMLAPIALYPDALLAQILVAAAFPDQVAEADTWLKANPDLKGDALNGALDKMNWDLSVKALVPFPQVLAMMVEQTAWTQKLGEAFTAQESDVIAAVQKLRSQAYAAGNLKSSAEQKVVVKGDTYEVEPTNPEEVYVPRYDPAVVYGSWGYPAYPPFAYYPVWPGVGIGIGLGVFGFWGGIGVGPAWGWGWGSWNWGGRSMNVNVNRNININSRNGNFNRNFRTTNARSVAGRGAAGVGRGGAGGTGGRPSAASFERGLRSGGSRGAAGNVSRSGSRGTGGRSTGNVSRSGSRSGGSRSGASRGSASRSGGGSRSAGATRGGSRGGGGHGGGGHGGGGHGGGGHGGGGHGGGGHGGGGHGGGRK